MQLFQLHGRINDTINVASSQLPQLRQLLMVTPSLKRISSVLLISSSSSFLCLNIPLHTLQFSPLSLPLHQITISKHLIHKPNLCFMPLSIPLRLYWPILLSLPFIDRINLPVKCLGFLNKTFIIVIGKSMRSSSRSLSL